MRYLVAILGVLLVVAGLAGVKAKQIGSLIAAGKQFEKMGPPPETVGSAVAKEDAWEGTLTAVGSVAAVRGVAVSNDAPGVVSAIHFESGARVQEGQVLLELDSKVERAQLASAVARSELAELSASRSRKLVEKGSLAQAQLDTDESGLKTVHADIDGLKAQIDRKIVRAPFSGRVGIRQVNLGQYLSPGTPLTVLDSLGSVFVDFSLPQQELARLGVGMPVRLTIDGAEMQIPDGKITAIDPSIDATTRTIKLRANVPDKEEKLRPGMFVNVAVVLPNKAQVVVVPATALIHAPYGDSVFVVEDKKDESGQVAKGADGKPLEIARQQFVRVGEARGDFVSIADGVKAGQELVTVGAFKLRNGAGITIDNTVKVEPQLAPKPENR